MVDNVTEVFRSWRAGHGHPVLAARPAGAGARRATPDLEGIRGYAEDSGEGRWTVEAAIEHAVPLPAIAAVALRPLRLPPGRQPGDEGGRGDAQPVRRPRGQAGRAAGAGPDTRDEPRPDRPTERRDHGARLPPDPPRLPVLRHARAAAGARGHGVRRPQRAGQDQHRRGGRLPVAADLAPGRQPTRRWCKQGADRRVVAGRGRQGGPQARHRGRDQPRPLQPGPGQPARRCRAPATSSAWCARCCSRPRTWRWSRATRPTGAASSTTSWCCATPAAGRGAADYDRVLGSATRC